MAAQVPAQQISYIDPAAVAAAESAKARIQSAYQMALYKQRDIDESRDRILHACKRPSFAEKVEFSKPVGNKQIKGPSIRFAELALREWGNILSDVQILYEDDFVRRSRIMVADLETNASFSKEIQINKTVERSKAGTDREILGERINKEGKTVYIVKATEDELQNKENAAISKAVRNEGLRIIPSDIIDEAMMVARETLVNRDKADPDQAKKKILDAFSELGIKPKDLQKYLGHSANSLSPKELNDLRGMYRAIKDGESSWSDYISSPPTSKDEDFDNKDDEELLREFEASIPKGAVAEDIAVYLEAVAKANKISVNDLKIGSARDKKDLDKLWKTFLAWVKKTKKNEEANSDNPEMAPAACPNNKDIVYTQKHCDEDCQVREGCPVW